MEGFRKSLTWVVVVLFPLAIQMARAEVWTTNNFSTAGAAAAMSADGRVEVASGGATLVSHDYGATWQTNSFGGTCAVSADGSTLIVVGNGSVQISNDAGTNWLSYPAPSTITARHIACSSDASRVGLILYASNPIFISTNGGVAWSTNNDAPVSSWTCIASSASGQRLLATSLTSGLWLSTNYGVNWSSILSSNNLAGVACSADEKTIVVSSTSDVVYLSTDFGATWSWQSVSVYGGSGAACSADGKRLGAISYMGVFISTNSGLTWTAQSGGGTVLDAIATSADGHRWITGHSGQGRVYLGTSTPDPALSIASTSGNVTVAWTVPSAPFVLQQTPGTLTQGNWSPVIGSPGLNLNTLRNEISLATTNSAAFFRLAGQ